MVTMTVSSGSTASSSATVAARWATAAVHHQPGPGLQRGATVHHPVEVGHGRRQPRSPVLGLDELEHVTLARRGERLARTPGPHDPAQMLDHLVLAVVEQVFFLGK